PEVYETEGDQHDHGDDDRVERREQPVDPAADDCCDGRGYDQFCDTSCPRARRTLELAAERAPQGEPLEPCACARSERDPDRSERLAGKTDALQQEHQPCT